MTNLRIGHGYDVHRLTERRRLVLGADAAVTSFRLREQRYGVLSEVLVRDRTTEEVQRVAD